MRTQIFAFDYSCKPVLFDCSDPEASWICGEQKAGNYHLYPLHKLNGETCSGERTCVDVERMFDNCMLSKMKGRKRYEKATVIKVCQRIACKPNFFEKLKFD